MKSIKIQVTPEIAEIVDMLKQVPDSYILEFKTKLDQFINTKKYIQIDFNTITTIVCNYFNTTFEAINILSRKREYCKIRQIIMYFACKFNSGSLVFISTKFNGASLKDSKKNHATVINARTKVIQSMFRNALATKEIEDIEKLILTNKK